MNNEPVAWMYYDAWNKLKLGKTMPPDPNWFPVYTHPAKELHLSLQKSKETGELLAVTYTDDEHRIVEVLWQKPPAKTLTDEEIAEIYHSENRFSPQGNFAYYGFARAILRKAQE